MSISVVMPTYNRANYICRALDSLLEQTEPPAEVIVIDDHSTDDTSVCVPRHPMGDRIRYNVLPQRRGAALARNVGVEMALHDTVVFLDSDDELVPTHHEQVRSCFAKDPELGLYCCDAQTVGPAGERLSNLTWTGVQCQLKGRSISSGRRTLAEVVSFPTPFPGAAVRRGTYARVGGLDQRLFPVEDLDLQIRMAGEGWGVYYDHQPLARYRIHVGNESGIGRAVLVGEKKLECIELNVRRYAALLDTALTRRRIAEVQTELAIALLREGRLGRGLGHLAQAVVRDPAAARELFRIAARKAARMWSR